MKSIVVIINKDSNNEVLYHSALNSAIFFKCTLHFVYLLEAPLNWSNLGRSMKDKHLKIKEEISVAKDLIDGYLKETRRTGITSSKRIYYFQNIRFNEQLECDPNTLVLTCTSTICQRAAKEFIVGANSHTLIVENKLEIEELNFGLFNSDFKTKSEFTSEILNTVLENERFCLNLVYINTKLISEESSISIDNMKKIINSYALSKTKISIFFSETLNKGLKSFVELNDADIVFREVGDQITLRDLNLNFTPTFLIRQQ